jgi:hypothetical protein
MNIDTDIRELSRTPPPLSLPLPCPSLLMLGDYSKRRVSGFRPYRYLCARSSFCLNHPAEWAAWDGIRAFEAKNHDYLQVKLAKFSQLFPAPNLPLSVRLLCCDLRPAQQVGKRPNHRQNVFGGGLECEILRNHSNTTRVITESRVEAGGLFFLFFVAHQHDSHGSRQVSHSQTYSTYLEYSCT